MPVAVPKTEYFQVLDLNPDDTGVEDIRIAYKRLALKWHPDRHTTDKEEAQQKFIEISEAYRALLQEYQHKKRGRSPRAKRGHPPASTPSASSSQSRSSDSSSAGPSAKTAERRHSTQATSPQSSPKSRPREDFGSTLSDRGSSHRTSTAQSQSDGLSQDFPEYNDDVRRRSTSSSCTADSKAQSSSPSRPESSHPRSSSSSRTGDSPSRSSTSLPKSSEHHVHFASPPRKRPAYQRSEASDHSRTTLGPTHKRSKLDDDLIDYEFINLGTPIPPLRSSRSSSRLSEDWIFPLHLSLEDLYYGETQHYRITRTLRTGTTESVKVDVHISHGWRTGTRIRVPGVGNERKDGSFQDIVFVVEEEPHPRFTRVDDNLIVSVQIPWADTHPRVFVYPQRDESEKTGYDDEVYVQGIDGEEFALSIPRTLVEGADGTRIVGAGMPVRKGGKIVGKGDLIVRWEFVFPEAESPQRSRWQALKKAVYWRS